MVLYADHESFTFMTPEGHTLSAWITLLALSEDGVTVAQAQALEALARHVGVAEPQIETQRTCVDSPRRWRHVRNLRHSATIHSAISTVTAPVPWVGRRVARRAAG